MENEKYIIGTNIKKYREEKLQINGEQLGERLGLSRSAVSTWEIGRSKPRFKTLLRLAEMFGVTLDELRHGPKKDNPPLPQSNLEVIIREECKGIRDMLEKVLVALEEKQKLPQEGQAPASKTAKST